MTTALPARDTDGQYPALAWPGGYPLFYFDAQNATLCPACASKPADEYTEPVVAYDVNWEDSSLYCDDCGERIPSAYGDDEEEEEEEESEPEADDSDPYQYGPEDTSNEPDPYGHEIPFAYNEDGW